jgi:hypothetical protein
VAANYQHYCYNKQRDLKDDYIGVLGTEQYGNTTTTTTATEEGRRDDEKKERRTGHRSKQASNHRNGRRM